MKKQIPLRLMVFSYIYRRLSVFVGTYQLIVSEKDHKKLCFDVSRPE